MCTGVTHRQLTRSLDAKVDLRRTRTRLAGDDFKTRKLEEGPSAEAKASQLRHVMMTAFSALSMCRPMTFCPSVHGVEWAFVCVTLDLKTASFSIMFYHRGVFDAIFSVPACLGMTGPIPAGSPFVGVHAKVALLVSYDEGSTAAKMALVVHEWDSNDLIYAGYLDIGWTIYTESGQDARWIIATHEENEPALYAFDFATTQDSLHFRALLTEGLNLAWELVKRHQVALDLYASTICYLPHPEPPPVYVPPPAYSHHVVGTEVRTADHVGRRERLVFNASSSQRGRGSSGSGRGLLSGSFCGWPLALVFEMDMVLIYLDLREVSKPLPR
ncbi:hypothetical protein C8Q74DRAFT_1222092 [Fomes fomentarius]|nr:hypothetical protein C8Q74DRAFT_1222092 [Fomes fomentarius]